MVRQRVPRWRPSPSSNTPEQNNDRDPILTAIGGTTPTSVVSGYMREDVNLSGYVKYTGAANDRDPILVNIGSTVPTNVRYEQIP